MGRCEGAQPKEKCVFVAADRSQWSPSQESPYGFKKFKVLYGSGRKKNISRSQTHGDTHSHSKARCHMPKVLLAHTVRCLIGFGAPYTHVHVPKHHTTRGTVIIVARHKAYRLSVARRCRSRRARFRWAGPWGRFSDGVSSSPLPHSDVELT